MDWRQLLAAIEITGQVGLVVDLTGLGGGGDRYVRVTRGSSSCDVLSQLTLGRTSPKYYRSERRLAKLKEHNW